ncbi:MAG: B12-binding domain-containing radical SAM protein [Chloroflexi bacterium RBG_16_50_11]|nr:MAG: B12-binding domain-containing radical SAM protein [Chloroflexi bacterium RBG_16_50_11]
MKILLVYPRYPDTFWSFRHALKFLSKKATFPPLGLLTVAAMLPAAWEKKVADLNVNPLRDEDIKWADYVFISSMVVQKDSAKEVITRCKKLNIKVVAGGPLFTTGYEEFTGVDHFVLGEAEVTLPQFLSDLSKGCPQHIYSSDERPDINQTPIPLWSLLNMKDYSAMSLQYSRGCPFDCDFCDIIVLNGHTPRTKGSQQTIDELDALYNRGWRGSLFIVDDNFIGNKKKLKTETLPAMIKWSQERKYPFLFFTEASINLADDDDLMDLMAEAGFNRVFIGIETPNEESLVECNKHQNRNRDMADAVKKIQNHGFEVQGGFILGFDNDPLSIFKKQINFIQKTGIVTAMVGLLNAPNGTKLYQRLKQENRLLKNFTGDNTDFSINFIPKMKYETLVEGYKHVLDTIYSPRHYYERVVAFLKEYKPRKTAGISKLKFSHVIGFFKTLWCLGVTNKGRMYFWRLFFTTLLKRPRHFPISLGLSVSGFHFRKVAESYNKILIQLRRQGA